MVVCAIQLECIFLQRVKKDTGQAFMGVVKVMQETFLPCVFFGRLPPPPPILGALSMLAVNKAGPGLKNPVTSEVEKYASSLRANY